ncbi:ABC transporter ATP-binding protein [Puniceibacterium sp. IMCC21224]|uniref:ABC transporter ATP-binding protein n=1 Tax=Puniceibacterium sp. IMCC21224 TaxID=1618204 RepID=UPI00064DBF00|nr:ABC transporter ATP-binding protein [Puniceibacterium sp. IMCC21224]KMK66193.1 ABC-type nitrate/sulfonate/bicarbonate transport system, ATPase component [Puniceibacterium sp. IMCC21224]
MTSAPGITLHGTCTMAGLPLFGPLTLEVPGAQWTCLLGRSGVGKSTVLRLILDLPTGAEFAGAIASSDGSALAGRVSYMAQTDLLLPWLDVLGNVVLGARLRGAVPDLDRANALLDQVGLAAHRHKRPGALSGGMRQRAALARTLMEDTPVVLLDEPFSALDASTRADMQDLAADVLTGRTVLMVTHDPTEAARLGHRIVVMSPSEATVWPVPDTAPVRKHDAPDTLACQAALLDHLRDRSPVI